MDVSTLKKFALENPSIDGERFRRDFSYRMSILSIVAQTEEGRRELVRAALSWRRNAGERERGEYTEYTPPRPEEASVAALARAGALALWRGVSWVVRQGVGRPLATAGVLLSVEAAVSYWNGREPEALRLYRSGRDVLLGVSEGAAVAARAAGGIAQQVSRWFPALALGAGVYLLYAIRRK